MLISLYISGKPEIEYQPKYGFFHVACWLLIGLYISGESEIEYQPKYVFYHVSCWLLIGLYISGEPDREYNRKYVFTTCLADCWLVYISVGNRIENITGSMAGALLSLHHLDLRNPPTDHIIHMSTIYLFCIDLFSIIRSSFLSLSTNFRQTVK